MKVYEALDKVCDLEKIEEGQFEAITFGKLSIVGFDYVDGEGSVVVVTLLDSKTLGDYLSRQAALKDMSLSTLCYDKILELEEYRGRNLKRHRIESGKEQERNLKRHKGM